MKAKGAAITIILAILFVAAAGAAGYAYTQYQKSQKELEKIKKDPQAAAQQEADAIIASVGKLIELPKDEKPTIATVTDVGKLKGQAFFAKAKNGDKVLIYPEAKKAILYRQSANRVIEVAPVNIGQNNTPTPTPTKAKAKAKATPTPTKKPATSTTPTPTDEE